MSKLKIEDLYVSVNDKEILKGLSIEFSSNETIALLGPNGNGKSTLLQTIMGNPNYTIKSGNIWFDDKDLTKLSVDEVIGRSQREKNQEHNGDYRSYKCVRTTVCCNDR